MRYLPSAIIALLTLATVLAVVGWSEAPASSFNPCSIYALSDSSPGANANTMSTLGVGIGADCQAIPADPGDPPDAMFDTVISFTPPEWGVARDADIPDGAIVAEVSAIAQLGLIGEGCGNRLFPSFNMMDATTNMNVTVPFHDPEEEFNPPDTNDTQGNEPDDQFDIGGDGLPLGVTRYPDYLTRIFPGLPPISRAYGQTEVAGVETSLNFVLFEPGTVFVTPAGETIATDAALGYPSVTVLQAGGDPDTEADIEDNNAVNDICSPLQADTTIFGVSQDNPDTAVDESGFAVRTNPPEGTYNLVTYAVSQYDADGDGIENPLDPCPFDANPNWDPRLKTMQPEYTGDQDKTGLPDECDPDPAVKGHHDPGGVFDEDYDRYGNRADNCPLIANSAGQLGGSGADNQRDSDLDGIGDACDPNPGIPDGQHFAVCLVSPVDIGGGGPPPDPAPQELEPCLGLPVPPTPTPTPTPVPPPPNDDLANTHPLTATDLPFSDTLDVAGATVEVGEPSGCLFLDSTGWYEFTSTTDQPVAANTSGSDVPEPFINVYRGPGGASFEDLSFETCGSSISFTANAGITYYFQVGGGYGAKSGTVAFNLTQGPPPTPGGKMYWAESGIGAIRRANLDGSHVEDLISTGLSSPFGIALDVAGGKMYWTDPGADKIQRANLDGTGVEDLIISGLSRPSGIALDVPSDKMYWTDSGTRKIQRASLDGSGMEDLASGLSLVGSPGGLALDLVGGKMYWADFSYGKIRRANLDGSDVEDVVVAAGCDLVDVALDLAGGKLYWTDIMCFAIRRANLDGSGVEDVVHVGSDDPVPVGVALDVADGKLYWTDRGSISWPPALPRKIYRANLDGSGVEDLLTMETSAPGLIALDVTPPTPTPTPVMIDIKPGSDPNPVNLGCHGVIPVAILTTVGFDAVTVDPETVLFEGAAAKHSALEDVDGDGDTDMILHFPCQDVIIEPDAEEACLQASTYDGPAFEGCDSVRLVPPDSPQDSDGDGFTDAAEVCVGTDPAVACGDGAGLPDWPPDWDDSQNVNLLDLVPFKPHYAAPNPFDPRYDPRFDLNTDSAINMLDLLPFKPFLNVNCTS